MNWLVVGGAFSASASSTIPSVTGQYFYLACIPIETRSAGNLNFTPSADTLPLTTAPENFTRSATVNGFAELQPAPGGGFVIRLSSVAGKNYAIHRTTNLAQGFTPLATSLATVPLNQSTGSTATNIAPHFYRVSVNP